MTRTAKQYLIIGLLMLGITALHYLVGTTGSPVHEIYRYLYFIPIVYAAYTMGFRGGIILSVIVGLFYSPYSLLTVGTFGWQAVNELMDIVLFFTVGIISGTLVEKKNIGLRKRDDELRRYVLLENYMNSIIESIRSGVVAVNNDMLITMMNKGASALLNLDDDYIGHPLKEVLADDEKTWLKIQQLLRMNESRESIELSRNGSNKESILKMSVFTLNLEGMQKGFIFILDEITEMKKLQQQVQRNDKLAALGELSAGIAHEIRNPLGIIKAIEQTMKRDLKDNQEAVNELNMIDEEVERANRVVKSLMEFGKPVKDEKTLWSVNRILDDVLAITEKYALQHGVRTLLEQTILPDAFLDKEQMKQVFINVIFNAVQAMPDGGELFIRTSKQGNTWMKIIFEDTGVGIPEANLEKIFNPFFTTRNDGTGLGLPLVQRIVAAHDGVTHVSSRIGIGTKFEIRLPV